MPSKVYIIALDIQSKYKKIKEGFNVKTLDEAIEQANVERANRYPLLELSENVEELSKIAEMAADYVVQMNDELMKPEPWEFVVRVVIETMEETMKYLDQRKSTEFAEIYIDFGTLFRISICYAETQQNDLNGTFNPAIRIGHDMAYDKRNESYNDAMSAKMAGELEDMGLKYLHPMFYDNKEIFKEIFEKTANNIAAKYGAKIPESESLSYIVVAFFRKAKEYLISQKDTPGGLEIKLARILTMGIEKEADGDYFISIIPGQEFKMEHAKSNAKSEIKEE